MRNGFQNEITESHQPKPRFSPTEQVAENAATLHASTAAPTNAVIVQDVKKELIWQNLFASRQYCRWMSIATVILAMFKLYLYPAGFIHTMPVAPTAVEMLLAILPFALWSIAFVLFYVGAMTPGISDEKIDTLFSALNEGILPEKEITVAAIHSRNSSNLSAHRGTVFLWIGIALTLFTPTILTLIKGG